MAKAAAAQRKKHPSKPSDYARIKSISVDLARVAPNDDPAVIAGAIVLFAAEIIRISSKDLLEARAYLDGMQGAIDQLLVNAFSDNGGDTRTPPKARAHAARRNP